MSIVHPNEALAALEGGANILDIKNPKEGTFGASHPTLIRKIVRQVNGEIPISVTLGDLPDLPGTAAMAALGAAVTGANYVKVGLYGVTTKMRAIKMLSGIRKALSTKNGDVQIIAAGYADFHGIGCLSPSQLVDAAQEAEVHGVLIDVASKLSLSLFDCLNQDALGRLAETAHQSGLEVAFAGGLRRNDIPRIYATHADILGIRRAACETVNGRMKISRSLVSEFTRLISLQPKIFAW